MSFEMKDSGKREQFATGAVRDVREGKGRYDLITPIGLQRVLALDPCLWEWHKPLKGVLLDALRHFAWYMEGYRDNEDHLAMAARDLMAYMELQDLSDSTAPEGVLVLASPAPRGLQRVAVIYEKGAVKYADRNWEKGMSISRILDSAMRHTTQTLMGKTDEDHAAHAAWNALAAMHMEEMVARGLKPAELNDLPQYLKAA